MYESRTLSFSAVLIRWCIFALVGLEWQVHSQVLPQTSEVDSSYNFYYEQPCCTGPVTKSKYHVRHKRAHPCTVFKGNTRDGYIANATRRKERRKRHCFMLPVAMKGEYNTVPS
ncbi:unnamed protein product, partial [Iphiclides podalirius]